MYVVRLDKYEEIKCPSCGNRMRAEVVESALGQEARYMHWLEEDCKKCKLIINPRFIKEEWKVKNQLVVLGQHS